MAAHRHIDGVYQWELSIPPASAMALLSAACVKLESSKPSFWDQVGAPRCWGIYFEGYQFGLFPLHRGKLYAIFGLPRGTIVPTKAGCRIELRHDNNQFERYGLEPLQRGVAWLAANAGLVFAAEMSLAS